MLMIVMAWITVIQSSAVNNKRSIVFQGQRYNTSGDIEMNPGPINGYMLLQSRLAECGLSILDGGGACDFFF